MNIYKTEVAAQKRIRYILRPWFSWPTSGFRAQSNNKTVVVDTVAHELGHLWSMCGVGATLDRVDGDPLARLVAAHSDPIPNEIQARAVNLLVSTAVQVRSDKNHVIWMTCLKEGFYSDTDYRFCDGSVEKQAQTPEIRRIADTVLGILKQYGEI